MTRAATLAAIGLLCGAVAGQKADSEAWRKDPYTLGEPAALRRAGYVSLGPFPWGDDHDSAKIHAMMPEAKILWIETAHFRLGCALKEVEVPQDSKVRRRMAGELKQLKRVLPRVKPGARKLDRWLRAHLFARRLEQVYGEVLQLLGVKDSDFGTSGKHAATGPILGMKDKFPVLLFQKSSDLTRYATKSGQPPAGKPVPICVFFKERGGLLYATSAEIVHSSRDPDHRLDCHMRFATARNLLAGYKGFQHTLPPWLEDGVGNWVVRRFDPEQHEFSAMKDQDFSRTYPHQWEVFARRLTGNGFGRPSEVLFGIAKASEMTFHDHICGWSRIDFLQRIDGGKKLAAFLAAMKEPMPHAPGKLVEASAVMDAQRTALKRIFGWSYAELDSAWAAWANKTYPRK
ncbi:MAG: hypothetical protein KDC87_09455 [Planctomycetes bacterium]|nr:hypothetical protein [Planctomycetota bacterium]MCB9889929.1 hypothetical protein [Planctomycetota bacterium]